MARCCCLCFSLSLSHGAAAAAAEVCGGLCIFFSQHFKIERHATRSRKHTRSRLSFSIRRRVVRGGVLTFLYTIEAGNLKLVLLPTDGCACYIASRLWPWHSIVYIYSIYGLSVYTNTVEWLARRKDIHLDKTPVEITPEN